MRAVLVPSHLSLARPSSRKHFAIFLDSSSQCEAVRVLPWASSQTLGNNACPPGGGGRSGKLSRRRRWVRFEDLSPVYLASALRLCCTVMSATQSFTIASSGESLPKPSSTHTGRGASCMPEDAPPISEMQQEQFHSNRVLLHAIERTKNDYVPNNLIYHRVQTDFDLSAQTTSAQTTTTGGGGGGGGIGCPLSPAASWLYALCRGSGGGATLSPPRVSTENPIEEEELPGEYTLPRLPVHAQAEAVRAERERVNMSLVQLSGEDMSTHHRVFHFFPFENDVSTSVAYVSTYFVVLVNLKPVVPGHLLIVPKRIVSSIHELREEEVSDWGNVLRATVDVLSEVYDYAADDGFSIAIQTGREAGQTVWHQHTHVIPYCVDSRLAGEPEEGDEEEQARRKPRTSEEMREEASMLRCYYDKMSANNNTTSGVRSSI